MKQSLTQPPHTKSLGPELVLRHAEVFPAGLLLFWDPGPPTSWFSQQTSHSFVLTPQSRPQGHSWGSFALSQNASSTTHFVLCPKFCPPQFKLTRALLKGKTRFPPFGIKNKIRSCSSQKYLLYPGAKCVKSYCEGPFLWGRGLPFPGGLSQQ